MPLLAGTDGAQKMSKSLGNHIGITEPPGEMYGKTLSLPDAALGEWYSLLLGRARRPRACAPRDAKRALARSLVARFHGDGRGRGGRGALRPRLRRARAADGDRGGGGARPPTASVHLPELIAEVFGGSRSEARRSSPRAG